MRFIDLFAGIGGIRMPFEEFGIECVFSSEWDKFSQITYEENYHGHGLREQALEMQNCILNNNIESKKMTHSDSISVMEIMDSVRYKVGLKY